jgi:hypothetical protein
MCSLNQWYLIPMCLVLGVMFGNCDFANLIAALLSSHTPHTFATSSWAIFNESDNNLNRSHSGSNTFIAIDNAMYSASQVDDNAISVCILELQMTGVLPIVIK